MSQDVLVRTWRDWSDGVITAIQADELPLSASPRARNSKLTKVGPGRAVVSSRLGCTTVNATPITGSPGIHGQLDFKAYNTSTGVFTPYHLLVSDTGRLDYRDTATTTAVFDAAFSSPFTAGAYRPDMAVAANAAFFCNGQASNNWKAYIETASRKVRAWGITRPTVGTLAGAAGAAGSPSGTYELRVSFGNSRTGHESSNSNTAAATVTVTNQQISVSNIPVSGDAQVDTRYIYVRNTANQPQFYRAGTIANNVDTTVTLNFLQADLVTVAPSTSANDPPPTLSACEWHGSRMFGVGPAEPTTLLYSNLGKPEGWNSNNKELVNPLDGQAIIGLHSAHGVLIIFKRESCVLLIGDSPASWTLQDLDTRIGCTSPQSIVTVDGVTYWWSDFGLVSWSGSGRVRLISQELLTPSVDPTQLAYSAFTSVCAAVDSLNRVVLFAVPDLNETRNTRIIPFSYILDRFEAEQWNPLDVASFGQVDDSNSNPVIFIGGYHGQLFNWWNGPNDGVPSGTSSGTVVAATSTTLTDTAATFLTAGGALIGRYVYAIDSTGLTVQRRRISANTATQLTIAAAWTTTPNTTYTYKIGAIDWQWDLNTEDFGWPFNRKRVQRMFVQVTVTAAATLVVDFFNNFATTPTRSVSLSFGTGGTVYGTGVYGTATFGTSRAATAHANVAKVMQSIGTRLRCLTNTSMITLHKVQLSAELLSDNLGGGESGTQIR